MLLDLAEDQIGIYKDINNEFIFFQVIDSSSYPFRFGSISDDHKWIVALRSSTIVVYNFKD